MHLSSLVMFTPKRPGANMTHGGQNNDGALGLLLGLADADAIPALGRNIHRPAECEPDSSRGLAGLECLLGCATSDLFDHEIASEHTAVRFPELIGDG
jgi:hypothetical protein